MDINTVREEKKQNLIDALSFREPKKVPVGMQVISWPFSYAGVRYADIIDDPEAVARAYVKYLDIIDLDFLVVGSIRHPIKAYHALGNHSYRFSGDGSAIIHAQPDIEFMSVDEYPELIADPVGFKRKIAKRRCEAFRLPRADAYEKVKEALHEIDKWSTANNLINQHTFEEKGVLSLVGAPFNFRSPLSKIFDELRGMKDTLIDLRRRPDVLRAACNALLELIKDEMKAYDPEDFQSPFPLGRTVYHAECFISPSQFDEFFFDPLMELMLPFMEAGLKFFVMGEGKFKGTIDRYRKLPKGAVVIAIDQDDPFEIFDEIGDWQSIGAGITADLLQVGTKEQCTDYVKKCFDVFAPGGGFVFFQNKPLLCAGDAKIENLIAVYETANKLSLGGR